MAESVLAVRDAGAGDEAAWRRLWSGYVAFYEAQVPEEVTAATWRRALDPGCPLFVRVADRAGAIVGFSLSVVHEASWTLEPSCYLEDLFVDPAARGRGTGRALIADLVALGRARGWARLYWHTRAGNGARRLYDEFVAADDFVRYRMPLR